MALRSYKVKLALDIIKEHFGPIVSEVASYLIQNENLSLQAIMRHFHLHKNGPEGIIPVSTVRDCLLVLHRHNILHIEFKPIYSSNASDDVTKEIADKRAKRSNILQYSIRLDTVLYRLRFGRALQVARSVAGLRGLAIMEEMIFQGQCSIDRIVRVISKSLASQPDNGDTDSEIMKLKQLELSELNKVVFNSVQDLVTARLFVRVDLLTTTKNIQALVKNERRPKSASAVAAESKRKRDEGFSDNLPALVSRKKASSNYSSVATREEEFDSPAVSSVASIDNSVLYTIGWEAIFSHLRHLAVLTAVQQRTSPSASRVVECLLAASVHHEQTSKDSVTRPMSFTAILDNINRTNAEAVNKGSTTLPNRPDVTLPPLIYSAQLLKLLEELETDALGIVSREMSDSERPSDMYVVNTAIVVEKIKRGVRKSIALEKFGRQASRVVELLWRKSYLDQQTVAEMSIVPPRETRELLYLLYREKWIDYVEICKRVDYNPASTFYLWHIDAGKLDKMLSEAIFESIYKLKYRRSFECEKDKVIVDMTQAPDNENEAKKMEKLVHSCNRLDQAIFNVDYTARVSCGDFILLCVDSCMRVLVAYMETGCCVQASQPCR